MLSPFVGSILSTIVAPESISVSNVKVRNERNRRQGEGQSPLRGRCRPYADERAAERKPAASVLEANALGLKTCELGYQVYFTSVMDQTRRLSLAFEQNRLHQEVQKLMHPKLLGTDEVCQGRLEIGSSAL